MKSVFTEKSEMPTLAMLKKAIGMTFPIWQELQIYTCQLYPGAKEEWNYRGDKFGWSFSVKDHKRVIIYLLPRDKYFKVAFVFGKKAVEDVMESDIADKIKSELMEAKVYAEGRGIRIPVRDVSNVNDLKEMIRIKIANA